jgi:hypothetical protein
VHHRRREFRERAAKKIKTDYQVNKCMVHRDGKLLPDVGGDDTILVDQLSVLVASSVDGSVKLLGILKLAQGTGQSTASAVLEQLQF